jgi:A/G-specific adenine glycosylase
MIYYTLMPSTATSLFQKALSAWYRKNARALPWRETRDPYRIWVSEIMLQQTQVQTVIPYYERWLQKFPTLESLAKAPISDVLKSWAGLGYYRRARMLHEGAKHVVKDHSGIIPRNAEALRAIPGIGRYTAGAVASIAFEERVPVLDGNVIRILTRLYGMKDDIGSPKTLQKLWDTAGAVLPQKNIGDFNQALMELGATVCFPRNPQCAQCPVSKLCAAYASGNPENFPVKKKKEIAEALKTAALIVRSKGKVLIRRQPMRERWGGLWMFPHWKDRKSMLSEMGCQKSDLNHRMTVKHGFTKYRIALEVYEHPGTPAVSLPAAKWVRVSELSKYAFPSPHQKIAASLS